MDSTQRTFSWENFHSALCLKHLNNAITWNLYNVKNIYRKTFMVATMQKFSPANLPIYGTYFDYQLKNW